MQGLHGIQKLFNLHYQVSEFSCFFSLKLLKQEQKAESFDSHFMEWVSNSNVKLITSLASPGVEGGGGCSMHNVLYGKALSRGPTHNLFVY